MTIKDILLPLISYPQPAATVAIEKCVAMAAYLGARVSALAVETDVPLRPLVIATDDTIGIDTAASLTGASSARDMLAAFESAAIPLAIRHDVSTARYAIGDISNRLAGCARLKDLTLIPVRSDDAAARKTIEALIFDSGRPVLICPEQRASVLPAVLDHVAIAWDHTAQAARAVADAIPVMQRAVSVQIFTATDHRTAAEQASGAALVQHLAEHGVAARFETVGIAGSSVGKVFEAYVRANRIDLLVMGAYRHSRLNELVWGGATSTVIGQPPCWVLMSH